MKKVSLYIPESIQSQAQSHQEVAETYAEKIINLTGGVTSFEAKGYYKRKDGNGVDVEKNIVLYTFTDSESDTDVIKDWAKEIAQNFEQECVLVTVEDITPHFIEP